MAASDLDSRPV